ncbi:hypothetical protein CB1_000880050 [Camelus ferus]|nr:hypothetical protein CB1_000880050 [Camelus ferus]
MPFDVGLRRAVCPCWTRVVNQTPPNTPRNPASREENLGLTSGRSGTAPGLSEASAAQHSVLPSDDLGAPSTDTWLPVNSKAPDTLVLVPEAVWVRKTSRSQPVTSTEVDGVNQLGDSWEDALTWESDAGGSKAVLELFSGSAGGPSAVLGALEDVCQPSASGEGRAFQGKAAEFTQSTGEGPAEMQQRLLGLRGQETASTGPRPKQRSPQSLLGAAKEEARSFIKTPDVCRPPPPGPGRRVESVKAGAGTAAPARGPALSLAAPGRGPCRSSGTRSLLP